MDLRNELETRHLSTSAFLHLPQSDLSEPDAERFLRTQAGRGYLLVSIADDAAGHGDAPFRQTRKMVAPMPAGPFRQRNARFHNWLCDQGQEHMPLRFGQTPDAPAALAWLIPAPEAGEITAIGFRQAWDLDAGLREQWLLAWAREVGRQLHPAQRLLLQLPGTTQPAYWFYRTYRGDLPLEGTQTTRVCTLLAGLPRYSSDTNREGAVSHPEEDASGQLLVNEYPRTWGQKVVRSRDHREVSPFWDGADFY